MLEHRDSPKRDTPPPARQRRVAKSIAVINVDYCTGCEACIAVCPVDCIQLIQTEPGVKGVQSWCEIQLDRCIGCSLCVQLPQRRDEPYQLKICPWDAIEMTPTEQLPEAISTVGGPDWYVAQRHPQLLEIARQLARERSEQQ